MTDASDWCSELLRWSYSSIPPHLRSSQTRHERMQQISTMQHYATLACILHFRSLGLQPQDWSCEALWGQELRLPWAFERLEKAKVNSWLRTRALSVTCTSKTPAKHDTFNLVKVDWVWDLLGSLGTAMDLFQILILRRKYTNWQNVQAHSVTAIAELYPCSLMLGVIRLTLAKAPKLQIDHAAMQLSFCEERDIDREGETVHSRLIATGKYLILCNGSFEGRLYCYKIGLLTLTM